MNNKKKLPKPPYNLIWIKSCYRKERHVTPEAAAEHQKRLEDTTGLKYRTYHCNFCKGYHVTHQNRKERHIHAAKPE